MIPGPSPPAESKLEQDPLGEFCQVLIDDLSMFIVLHDREPTAELIAALQETCFPLGLGLKLDSETGRQALEIMQKAIVSVSDPADSAFLDSLAVDYADIYLLHGLKASPLESVWTDEEHLTCQDAMFRLRELYEHHGLAAEDWRRRSDDHLVLQISFIVQLLQRSPSIVTLEEVARFLDDHLLRWLPEFARRVAERCSTAYFAGLCMLTSAYCETLRDVLARSMDMPRANSADAAERTGGDSDRERLAVRFVPGMGPTL